MARIVSDLRRSLLLGLALLALPAASSAQQWGEPIASPKQKEPPPSEKPPPPEPRSAPNPDWADPEPIEAESRSPQNPDWVEESEPPVMGKMRRKASAAYDIRYANRDLTMPRGMMRGTFDTLVGRQEGAATIPSAMSFGAAITLAEGFELGFSRYRMGSFPDQSYLPRLGGLAGEGLIAFSMSPQAKFGDIPVYARFQALDREVAKMAFDAVFRIPSRTEFGFLAGVPLRFIIQEQFAFDTGLQMVVDNNPQGPALWSLNVPFKFVANATDRLFLELETGIDIFDLSQTLRTVTSGLVQGPFYFIPLGLRAGYSAEARATMMDFFVSFRFPTFFGFTTRASELLTGTWQVTVGFNVYSPILFKGSAL